MNLSTGVIVLPSFTDHFVRHVMTIVQTVKQNAYMVSVLMIQETHLMFQTTHVFVRLVVLRS